MTSFRLGLALVVVGCAAAALPPTYSQQKLYRDLDRLVSLESATGWDIDRVEVEELLPSALMSACQVRVEERAQLLAWLDVRIAALGGPVDRAYDRRGRNLGAVADLLAITRVRRLLAHAQETAAADCPFWLTPRAQFTGRQIEDDKWQLSLGGGGKGIVAVQGGATELSAGGAGRVVFGRAFGTRWTWLAGVEIGAGAAFPEDSMGNRGSVVLTLDTVFPVVVRYRFLSTYLEAEVGYLLHARENNPSLDPGARVGLSFGGRAARADWFFPGAAFTVSYERTFPGAADAPLHMIKAGLRVAIDIDL